jgi:Tol biopolymer transport system component
VTSRVTGSVGGGVGSLAWSADGKQIAFAASRQSPRGSVEHVYIVASGGGQQRRLALGTAPRWSSDGTAIAIQEGHNPDDYRLVVIRPNGRRVWRRDGYLPSWPPDGKRIAFWTGTRSVVAAPNGRILVRLPGRFDTWSPDGSRITYTVGEAASRPLYVADWNGGHARRIGETGAYGRAASRWEPNGRRLVLDGRVRGRYGQHLVSVADGRARLLPATAIAEWLPSGGDLLAYARGELVVMAPDGAVRTRLTRRDPRIETLLAIGWTRDGGVVYESHSFLENRLFTMRPDGKGVRLFASDGYARTSPAWSPDGRTLGFSRCTIPGWCKGASIEIYTAVADGTGARRLTTGGDQNPTADGDASWSPDGTRLVFRRSGAADGGSVYIVGADGSGLTRLGDGYAADWSPDGSRIAISRSDGLILINPDGSGVTRIVGPTGSGQYPTAASPNWSPDGTRLAFAGSDGIYVVGAEGRGLRRVTAGRGRDVSGADNPEWSPDGTMIVFDDCSRCIERVDRDLYVVRADGSGRRRLTSAVGDDSAASWQPVG